MNGKRQTRAATGWSCPAVLVEKEKAVQLSHRAQRDQRHRAAVFTFSVPAFQLSAALR